MADISTTPAPSADPYEGLGSPTPPPAVSDPYEGLGSPTPPAKADPYEGLGTPVPSPAQSEANLRQIYSEEMAKTGGSPWLLHPLQSAGAAAAAVPGAAWSMVKDLPSLARLRGSPENLAAALENGQSVLEGGYQAGAGIGSLVKGLITTPASAIKTAYQQYTGTAPAPEEEYQKWRLNYLQTKTLPGYAAAPASPPSAIQTAESAYTGIPAEALPAPNPELASAVSTVATIPLYGGVSKLTAGILPKVLEATGAAEALPNLTKAVTPVTTAAKLHEAMTTALEAAPAAAEPTGGVVASVGKAVSGAGKAAQVVGAVPENFTKWVTGKLTGSPDLADKVGKYINMGEWLAAPLAASLGSPSVAMGVGIVKALETGGAIGEGLGDFMTRVATADPTNPYGRFMALAADKDAPAWMRQVAQAPAVQFALKTGNLAAGVAKGAVKGVAGGIALGAASGQTPEEAGGTGAGMGLFGAAHGGMSAREGKIFDASIGAVTKFIGDHLDNGGSPDTLRLVPAGDVLQAALWNNVNPDVKIRFATAADAGSPFAPGGVAEGQAGLWDGSTQNKTVGIDPAKRAPGATLTHEMFHPIFDNLVSQRPDIKEALDSALTADGRSIDDFKQQYANRVFANDPQRAADYIKTQDAANPDWGYSELLADSAAHELTGKNLLEAAGGKAVEQSATQAALSGMQGWLSAQGVKLRENTQGDIFPDFQNVFQSPDVRKLTYKLLKTQRETVLGNAPKENPGRALTKADMGTKTAPFYQTPTGQKVNPYGKMMPDGKGGEKFVQWPSGELRRRAQAEFVARKKYFQPGQMATSMPAGLEADPNIAPWTKAALKNVFDSMQTKDNLSMWYHRLNSENSATSDKSYAADVRRSLGNVAVSYQSGKPMGVELTSKGNLVTRWESEEAENQKLQDWANRKGDLSLDLWGGDQAKAKADIKTYLQNHATGQPGEANGIGTQKRDVINALLAGGNKEFEAKNPLRAQIRGKDRAGIMRSLRVDRMESATPEPSERAPAQWESLKRNLSPGAFPPSVKRDIELTGPDGKKYPAIYGGIQETLDPKAPWLTITPKVDLPGAAAANSTTYAHQLAKKGYTVPPELLNELKNHVAAQPQFSPSEDPKAIKSAAVRDEETGKVYPGMFHSDAAEAYLNDKFPDQDNNHLRAFTDNPKLSEGFLTNEGEYLNRDQAYQRAIEHNQYKVTKKDEGGLETAEFRKQQAKATSFSPSESAKRDIELTGPDGKKYPATYDGIQEDGQGGGWIQITPKVNLPGVGAGKSTTYAPLLEKKGYIVPPNLAEELQKYIAMQQFSPSEDPKGIKAAASNSGDFSATNPNIHFSPSDEDTEARYSSKLKSTIDEKFSGENMPAAQLAAILRNPSNGIKADELKWSGIDDFLKGKHRVTKAEVQDYLDNADLTPIEVTKNSGMETYWVETEDTENGPPSWELHDESGNQTNVWIVEDKQPSGNNYTVYSGYSSTARGTQTLEEAKEKAMEFYTGDQGETEYSKYSLPGPKGNYREILFQLPVSASRPDFKSPHWDEKNVVAHARVDNRYNVEGKQGLFVEEVQSDWHQEGRKKGYSQNGIWKIVSKNRTSGYLPTYNTEAEAKDALKKMHPNVQLDHEVAFYKDQKNDGVPDAPLKTTWQETVFRRLVQLAAQTDKDWIGWTTGKQNADRYGLEKHLERVRWGKENSELSIKKHGEEYFSSMGSDVPEAKLQDYIGKELAQKLVDSEPNDLGFHELTGLDLKVGGEGMSGFYDKILVDYANKFGKKFGARVSTETVRGNANEKQPVHALQITPEMKASVKQGIPFYSPAGQSGTAQARKAAAAAPAIPRFSAPLAQPQKQNQ